MIFKGMKNWANHLSSAGKDEWGISFFFSFFKVGYDWQQWHTRSAVYERARTGSISLHPALCPAETLAPCWRASRSLSTCRLFSAWQHVSLWSDHFETVIFCQPECVFGISTLCCADTTTDAGKLRNFLLIKWKWTRGTRLCVCVCGFLTCWTTLQLQLRFSSCVLCFLWWSTNATPTLLATIASSTSCRDVFTCAKQPGTFTQVL